MKGKPVSNAAGRLATGKIVALAILLALGTVEAQESAFNATHQKMALLPGEVCNVSIVDGTLYCYASDVLLQAQRSDEQLLGFWADTTFVKIAEGVEYVVRHPGGDIYFTQRDRKGRSLLYRYRPDGGKRNKASKEKMGGMTVEHPAFTDDGRIMIFASADRRHSLGGYDLWYSVCEGGKWSKPTNLGGRINTSSDEVTPSIYRNCLLFASNGHDSGSPYLNIYASRLVSDRITGDTVGMLQIGRCKVQMLPEPLNSAEADDFDMAIDTANNCGYWVSKRSDSDSDSQLYSFYGGLDGVLLWGRITDRYENELSGVKVAASQGGTELCNTTTDIDGFYRLYLQCDQYYELSFKKDGYYTSIESINTSKTDDEYLITEKRLDAEMSGLPMNQRLHYNDLFGHDVDLELSDYGIEQLEPLVQFLNDNPATQVSITLSCDQTTDPAFNNLLTEHRLQTLEAYLYTNLPPSVGLTLENGCKGKDGCQTASSPSRLTVILTGYEND